MRRTDVIVVVIVLALVGFVAHAVLTAPRPAPAAPAAVSANAPEPVPLSANEIVSASTALPPPERNIDAIRQILLDRGHGTFIGEILAARDSNIARWPDRKSNPVTVWIDERSPLAGPDQALPVQVRRAFADWGVAGVPMTFTFVGDSASAEVHVTFVDHFDALMSGKTLWTRDPNWWIIRGDIQLSLRSGSGRLLKPDELYSVALHEIGHLLGLDHTSDTTAIMAPHVRVRVLSPADIATMQLIYELPPGTVKKK